MSEFSRAFRIAAPGLASLALFASGCGSQAPKPKAPKPAAAPKTEVVVSAKEVPKVRSHLLLAVGNKISQIRILKPRVGENESITLRPRQTKSPEDLCVIYSPGLSKALEQSLPDPRKNDYVGFLLTAWGGHATLTLVTFNDQSERVTSLSPSVEMQDENQSLFEYLNPAGEGFTVSVHPMGDKQDDVKVQIAALTATTPAPSGAPEAPQAPAI